MKKLLYFDTETTGVEPEKHDIIQIAGMIVINGKEKETFNFTCQPFSFENIEQEALDVHGITLEQIKTYPQPFEMHSQLVNLFSKYVNRYDKKDKFIPVGYNVTFDMNMLKHFFHKNGDKFFGSWVSWHMIDPLPTLRMLGFLKKINLPNYKLGSICEAWEIPLDAHDALNDIIATREVLNQINKRFFQ